MKSVFELSDIEMRKLKFLYIERLKEEGVLNEVLFGRPEWDDSEDNHTLEHYGVARLIDMIPTDVIVRQWEGEYFSEEDFAA